MEHNEIKEAVAERIEGGAVKMRPRSYFALRFALAIATTILIGLISAVFFNFILFHLGESGRSMLLGFGARGYEAFLRFFPWALLGIDLVLVSFLVWLLRQFSFGYKNPLLYILIAALVLTFGSGVMIRLRTRLDEGLLARHGELGPFGTLILHARRPPSPDEGVCRCTITAIHGDTLTAEAVYNGATSTRTIILPDDSDYATSTGLKVGDTVFVVGSVENGAIQAFGLRLVGERRMMPMMRATY